ncbi:cell division protein ZapA [Caldanaerobius fijiensis DSM 17918]|uniref:Cell division protein ZapA n=1 Tax=Caldanaerobius fijiensis DSM 17918 TaxID=1121256 RepID=A0A1M4XHK6_9THEO|nr:cell division protein ZapA [Caldanaerobius fijiensis]SHE92632.1 cell division protein ZapA [Caldanaerobius fijiensis DSM 17918]
MGEETKKTVVKINGHEYVMKGTVPEEYMHKLALYVDKKIAEVSEHNKKLSTVMVYILTAINIADELEREKREKEMLSAQLSELQNKVMSLVQENQRLKEELEKSRNELDEFINTFDNQNSKIRKLK